MARHLVVCAFSLGHGRDVYAGDLVESEELGEKTTQQRLREGRIGPALPPDPEPAAAAPGSGLGDGLQGEAAGEALEAAPGDSETIEDRDPEVQHRDPAVQNREPRAGRGSRR